MTFDPLSPWTRGPRGPRRASFPTLAALVMVGLVMTACDPGEPPEELEEMEELEGVSEEQDQFWASLQELCGTALSGGVEAEEAIENPIEDREMIMHVRVCHDDEIQIPVHVETEEGDWNRSRTWVVTREDTGLRLKHDHRYEDGEEEETTWYGGDTEDPGTAQRQQFHADEYTADLIPEAATNVWTMEIEPGERFTYQLVREGTDRMVRWSWDLDDTVEPPPAPWGHEDVEPTH